MHILLENVCVLRFRPTEFLYLQIEGTIYHHNMQTNPLHIQAELLNEAEILHLTSNPTQVNKRIILIFASL